MKDALTILTIAFIGWYGSITLSDINELLETVVLILTIGGLIFKILNFKSNGKENDSKEKRD